MTKNILAGPSIDDIVRRISAEAVRRQAPPGSGAAPIDFSQLVSRAGLAGPLAGPPAPAFATNDRKDYPLSAFTSLHGPAFVDACYSGILSRPADGAGLTHYLGLLQRGVAKSDIVGRFRLSAEGRRHGVRIRGLWPAFAFHSLARIPVLGALIHLPVDLLTLPMLKRRIRGIEDSAFTQATQNAQAVQNLLRRVEALERAARR